MGRTMNALERDGVSRSAATQAVLPPRRRRSRRRPAGTVVTGAPGGAAVVALPDGAPVGVELGADQLAWRFDGLEARLRALGFAAIALAVWTWTLHAERLALVWGVGLSLLTLGVLHAALRDRGEYAAATSVRLGRFGVAAAVLSLLATETVATLAHRPHGVGVIAAALGVCAAAAVYDLHVCRAAR